MALIAESKYTSPWSAGVPHTIKDKASNFKLEIPSVKLSIPYSLKDEDIVKGKILKVEDTDKRDYPELRGKEIDFVLYSLLSVDYLFISRKCWEEIFREYGLVLAFYVSVRLENAIRKDGNKEVSLYTKAELNA